MPNWITIAGFHSLLALLILTRPSPYPASRGPWLYLVGPATLIVLGSVVLALSFRGAYRPTWAWSEQDLGTWLGTIVWVPIVEEIVYRRGLGGFLRARLGQWTGLYLASLLFALAHGLRFEGGLPAPAIGPFLLGVACELIYWRCRSIWGAIAFHAACNATPLIFLWLDPRWLDRLRMLYLEV